MKKLLFAVLALSLFCKKADAQKEVLPIAMSEDSKFQISASAKSVTDVSLTIKVMADALEDTVKKELGFSDKGELKIEIKPFYESVFKQQLKGFLKKVSFYEQKSRWLKKIQQQNLEWDELKDRNKLNIILDDSIKNKLQGKLDTINYAKNITIVAENMEDVNKALITEWANKQLDNKRANHFFIDLYTNELVKYLGENTENQSSDNPEYYKAKIMIDESLDRLFQYFNNQIILLFKYDIEPVAGTLHYKTDIDGVQFFHSMHNRLWLQKLNTKYHRLIRRLYRLRRNRLTSNEVKNDLSNAIVERSNQEKDLYRIVIQDSIDSVIKLDVGKRINDIRKSLESTTNVKQLIEKLTGIINTNADYLKTITKYDYRDILELKFIRQRSREEVENYETALQFLEYFANNIDEVKARRKKLIEGELKDDKQSQRGVIENQINKVNSKGEFDFNSDSEMEIKERRLVQNYFDNDSRIHDDFIYAEPLEFLVDYNNVINNFRIYNRNKRIQLVNNISLEKLNKQQILDINNLIEQKDSINVEMDSIKWKIKYYKNKIELNRLERSFKATKKEEYALEFLKLEAYCKKKEGSLNLRLREDRLHNHSIQEFKENLENEDLFFFWDYDESDMCNWLELFKDDIADQLVSSSLSKMFKPGYVFDLEENKFENGKIEKLLENLEEQRDKIQIEQEEIESMYKPENSKDKRNVLARDWGYDDFDYQESILTDETVISFSDKIKSLENLLDIKSDSLELQNKKVANAVNEAPKWKFKAKKIELDINDGFIENIVVFAEKVNVSDKESTLSKDYSKNVKNILDKNSNNFFVFKNQFPYGFSSSADYDDFKDYELAVYHGKHRQYEVRLEEIFPNYVQKLQNDRLDFSPRDQVVTLPEVGKEDGGSIELKKETSSKLFNLSVYTDFLGLRGDPNGIVQFEFNKPIPIYTKRKTSNFGERYLGRGFNYGFFNYINPQLRWSRLDANDDDRNLKLSYLDTFEGGTETEVPFVTTLDLLRYENVSVGADLNVLSLDFPTAKWRLEANISARYGRTRVLDTEGREITNDDTSAIVDRDEINTWRYYPEVIFRLRPEERYGANLSLRAMRFNTVTKEFSTISSEESFRQNLMDNPQWLHQLEINAHFSPSARRDDKFFFRYRYSNNANWETNGYSEIQVGYNMSLKF